MKLKFLLVGIDKIGIKTKNKRFIIAAERECQKNRFRVTPIKSIEFQ